MSKDFINWFKLKPKIDKLNYKPPLISEAQIWWCHFGENIGTEINGKSENYTRPAIIFKKLSRYTFLVVPTSTQIKEGTWFVDFSLQEINMVACLHQIRVIDYRRIFNYKGKLDSKIFGEINKAFLKLYKK
jgi:mRNA interferase MazF